MAVIMNPPDPFGARAYNRSRATPGSLSIARDKYGIVVHVGQLRIHNRVTYDDYGIHRCAVCGHPYDHNGAPHSTIRQAPIRRGEALTGPDGNVYNWDGTMWKIR